MSAWNEVTRDHLQAWADVDGPRELPILIRRLILETDPSVEAIDFPGGTGVQLAGHDGFVRTAEGNAFVPKGVSVWELSVNKKAADKVEEDFSKRTSVPDGSPPSSATYVQAICRPWVKASTWANEKTSGGPWGEVRGYNVDRIATWLEQAPATRLWFLERTGRPTAGVSSADRWWEIWSTATTPAFTNELVLARIGDVATEISSAIQHQGLVTVAGPIGANELIACVVAALNRDARPTRPVLIVKEQTVLERLLAESAPLVLVVEDASLAECVPAGIHHTVVAPTPMSDRGTVVIPKLDSAGCASILQSLGVSDPDQNGRLARRSLIALRRRLRANHLGSLPSWVSTSPSRAVRCAVLLTSWDDSNEADRSVVELLTGKLYPEVREELLQLTHGPDPMLLLSGSRWQLVSPLDSFLVVARFLLADDLTAFVETAEGVLGETDPLFGLEGSDRMVAQFQGKQRKHSSLLRKGMADGLARLGSFGDEVAQTGTNGSNWARRTVRVLTESANADPSGKQWAGLADVIPELMEAAPDELLAALWTGTKGDPPVLGAIFQDRTSGWFGDDATHSSFQWALERAGWSRAHMGRACEVLARLAQIDPGGKYSNRPGGSLLNIHCLWYSGTSAKREDRLAAIDSLTRKFPDQAWKLMVSLLDRPGGVLANALPEYRDWAPPHRLEVTRAEYADMSAAILDRIIRDVGSSPTRWIDVTELLPRMPLAKRTEVLGTFASTGFDKQDPDLMLLWDDVRKIIARHREHSDAAWAMPAAELSMLESGLTLIAPTDPVHKYAWLFDYQVELGTLRRVDDFEAYDAEVLRQRAVALTAVLEAEGLPGVERLAGSCNSGFVGDALAAGFGDQFLGEMLAESESSGGLAAVAISYLSRLCRTDGIEWVKSVLATHPEISAVLRARLLHDTYDFDSVMVQLAVESEEVASAHWGLFRWWGRGHDFPHGLLVAERLTEVGRWATAVQVLTLFDSDPENRVELIAQAMEAAMEGTDVIETATVLSSWELDRALKILDAGSESVGVDRVVRIQWSFGRFGEDQEDGAVSSSTIHSYLAASPPFFADLVTRLYRPRNTSETSDPQSEQGEHEGFHSTAFRLMRAWAIPPGMHPDGSFDRDAFMAWFDEAMSILDANGRGEVGRGLIGEVLSFLFTKGDMWPESDVSDLIEELDDDRVDSGIQTRMINRRGATSRGMADGGNQEWELAKDYEDRASRVAATHPRVAALLAGLADRYEREARREDLEAERYRLGLER